MNENFTLQIIRDKIVKYLKELDYLLFNENDLQIYLAIKFKEDHYKVYTEYHLPKDFNEDFDKDYKLWKTEKPSIDIVLEEEGEYIAIELKYKLKEIKDKLERFGKKSNKEITLVTNQSAQNEGRYDFWKDVKRLELIKKHYKILGGIALLLTNDQSYTNTSPDSRYEKFGLDNKKEKGLLHWGSDNNPELGERKKENKKGESYYVRPNFNLEHTYEGKWEYEIKIVDIDYYLYTVVVDNE